MCYFDTGHCVLTQKDIKNLKRARLRFLGVDVITGCAVAQALC